MFTAPFTSAFIAVSHDSQTYRPRPHDSSLESVRTTNTSSTCSPRLRGQRGYRVPRPCIRVDGRIGQTPSVEFLVPRRTPVPRVAVLIFADIAKIANRYLPYTFFDILLNDVLAESVEEVVFASGEFPPSLQRTFRRAVLAFGLVLIAGEIVFVLF